MLVQILRKTNIWSEI